MCVCVLERKREGQRERDHLISINLLVQSLAATESGVSHSPYITALSSGCLLYVGVPY